ncbi:pyridoxamine 5'-phosphate oxidase family protein [Sinobaca sp. H24]|uniref:pyridoxamine 5'-phosphate oxidase family protein n=1 Tax=Sinobaca sp. H24 TaxID=2923376 RepID=UPI00207AE2E6|nr:pyridoxamine 5'-phosphate oxidase family protein [Sinobaca sp. H24]
MANRMEKNLNDELLALLKKERYISLTTVDYETKAPDVRVLSWIYAPDRETLRFTIDNRSKMMENMKHNSGIVITVIGNGSTYAIAGEVKILKEEIEDVPIKLALAELDIKEVKDIMFYGAKMTLDPRYEKTYDAEAAAKLDNQVMKAMKTV